MICSCVGQERAVSDPPTRKGDDRKPSIPESFVYEEIGGVRKFCADMTKNMKNPRMV